MKTLSDFPQIKTNLSPDSPAMLYYTIVVVEAALNFRFFHYATGRRIPLGDIPTDRLDFLCDKFVEYLQEDE